MACLNRQFARVITTGGLALLLLPAHQMYAQSVPTRLRGGPEQAVPAAPAAPTAQSTPPQQLQDASAVSQSAPSMLQEPAREAQVVFAGDRLSIHADNSSLSAILQQVASKSGMKMDGLGGDERVFGTFGPGAPRDVLADLLNGTAYNVVLLGDLSNGAPRELILTPVTRGAAASAQAPQVSPDEANNEPESAEVPPPPPDVPPPGTAPIPPTAVKTPQQLFEQLQRMRSAQQQQTTTQQDPQQQQQQAPQ
jgi:hypothetical protein